MLVYDSSELTTDLLVNEQVRAFRILDSNTSFFICTEIKPFNSRPINLAESNIFAINLPTMKKDNGGLYLIYPTISHRIHM